MESDDQTVEELKRWWKENGRGVILGVILGIGGVSGWVGWRNYTQSVSESASVLYSRLVNTAALGNDTEALQQANELVAQYPDHAYAALAALVGARSAYRGGDPDNAVRLLNLAIAQAPEPEVAHAARIRLARVLGEKADFDGALATLDAIDDTAFDVVVAETRGDVLSMKGDMSAALNAYQAALDSEALADSDRDRIEGKLDHLASLGS